MNSLKELAEEYPPKRKTSNIRIRFPELYGKLVDYTNFLETSALTSQRLWHIRHDCLHIPTCANAECDNNVKWITKNCDYAKFCSKKCYNSTKKKTGEDREYNRKIELYGKNHEKLSRYEKAQITYQKKYGVDNPFQDVNKIKKKNLERYGTEFHFQQHLSPDCLKKLSDIAWLEEQHIEEKKSCTEIAEELGVHHSTIGKIFKRNDIVIRQYCNISYQEKQVVEFIKNILPDSETIITNDRSIISPYEIDVYLPNKKIAIEYCGLYWHSELNKDKEYHKTKLELCKEKGIQLITIFEDEWIEHEEIVKRTLQHKLGCYRGDKIFARNCTVRKISSNAKKAFLNNYHIQGNGDSSINIGLFDNSGELISVMALKTRTKGEVILNRHASKIPVVGGFSKALSFFEGLSDVTDGTKIITFADLRWSDGALYRKTGFELDKTLRPDYHYVINNIRSHKFNFRHSKLKTLLENYDPNKSEHDNCLANNIYRIYDCGKLRFTKVVFKNSP